MSEPAAPRQEDTGHIVRRLAGIAWEYRSDCLSLLGLQLLLTGLTVAILALTGAGIDVVRHAVEPDAPVSGLTGWLQSHLIGNDALKACLYLAALILLVAIGRAGLSYAYTIQSVRFLHGRVVVGMRARVYSKLQQLSFRFFDANASGSIINRVTADAHSIRLFIEGVVLQVAIISLTLAVCATYMFLTDWRLTLACLSLLPLQVWYAIRFSGRVRPAYEENRKLMDDLVLGFSESIQGVQTVKGLAAEERAKGDFARRNEAVRSQKQKVIGEVASFWPVVDGLSQLSLCILLGYGGWLFAQGQLALGTGLVTFAALLQQFAGQVATVATVVDNAQVALTGARRIFEILDTEPGVASRPEARSPGRFLGKVTFEGVSFEYRENNSVLRDISFTANPGERIAIAGATGSGKSALLSLIPRFYDPRSGRVTLDGHDLRDLPLAELRRQVGFVFQDNFLFSNTVAANIAFGHPDADRARIERAARIAGADGFIRELSEGYDSLLGESGVNLSGGQRQRLAIARALLLEPTVLLLDDPTSAIDPETEREILEAMEAAMEGRTTFIVAHRLATLRSADRILVLERGRLAQVGNHDELMAQDGPYRRGILVQTEGTAVP